MKEGFWGYVRPDGRVGTRNHVAIISTSDLVNSVARHIAAQVRGCIAITPPYGRTLFRDDAALFVRTLVGIGRNPNVAAVVIIGLEPVASERIAAPIAATGKPVAQVIVQRVHGTLAAVEQGSRLAARFVVAASAARREFVDLGRLALGLKCGGTDTTSGIAANPVVGWVTDRVVEAGGLVLFSEPSELLGAEELLCARAAATSVAAAIRDCITSYEREAIRRGVNLLGTNPTPDNIAGGITTIEEKALGSAAKSGHAPIQGVVRSAEAAPSQGLYLMDSPGPAVEVMAGMAAAGATLVLFTTGVGNPVGTPAAPTLKITGNPRTAAQAEENIDFSAGEVLQGRRSCAEVGDDLLALTLAVASGRLTYCEVLGDEEFAISRGEPAL